MNLKSSAGIKLQSSAACDRLLSTADQLQLGGADELHLTAVSELQTSEPYVISIVLCENVSSTLSSDKQSASTWGVN